LKETSDEILDKVAKELADNEQDVSGSGSFITLIEILMASKSEWSSLSLNEFSAKYKDHCNFIYGLF